MNITNSEEALKSYCKSKGYEKPIYEIISRASAKLSDNTYRHKYYCCSVKVNAQHLADGHGFSKRIARKKAAMYGLQNLRILEMTNFFQAFKDILPQRSINYQQNTSNGNVFIQNLKQEQIKFYPSVEIFEEIIGNGGDVSENVYNEISTMKKSKNIIVIDNDDNSNKNDDDDDPSDDLIRSAIAKLRSYDEVIDEIKTHHQNDNNNDDNDNDYNDKQMKKITKEILNLNLDDNDNDKIVKHETIQYIDDPVVQNNNIDKNYNIYTVSPTTYKIIKNNRKFTEQKIYKI